MARVIQTMIPGTNELVNRYPECPYAGAAVHCTGGKNWAGILTEDHLCANPRTTGVITCGERHQKLYQTCPMDLQKKRLHK